MFKENGDTGGAAASTTPPKSRYRNIVRTFDQKTGVRNDLETDGLPEKKKQDGEIAFTYRSIVLPNDPGDKIAWSEIDVEAVGLRLLLKECIGSNYPGLNLDGDTVNILNPFDPLVGEECVSIELFPTIIELLAAFCKNIFLSF